MIKKVAQFILFFIGAFAISYAYQYFSFKEKQSNVIADIERQVKEDVTNRTDSEKILDIVQGMAAKKLKSEVDVSNDRNRVFAAGVFSGQYARVFVSYDYCKSLNVDISEYVSKYKLLHKELYLKSDLILKKNGGSLVNSSNSVKNILPKYVKKEVEDLKTILRKETGNNSLTLADACEYFNIISRNKALMSSVMFKSVMPDSYKVLMK